MAERFRGTLKKSHVNNTRHQVESDVQAVALGGDMGRSPSRRVYIIKAILHEHGHRLNCPSFAQRSL